MVTLKINLAAAKHNLRLIKERTNSLIYAVVKADAYGHGTQLCRFIEEDVYGFAVSCPSEAEELRKLKIKKPILILCPSENIDYDDIIYTVCNANDLPQKKGVKVAIKINSGMNRLGCTQDSIGEILKKIKTNNLILSEVFTHFSSVKTAEKQFEEFTSILSFHSLNTVFHHCCASNCMNLHKSMLCSAVRCGLALYGYGAEGLMPILSAYTFVAQINKIQKGSVIGYGDYRAERDMTVAVLKAGYADGIRRLGNKSVRINGCNCKIVGNICMDMCFVDVENVYAEIGDRAYFLDNVLNAEVLAVQQGTIPYEILTMFTAKRIKRIYE